nr:DUF1934 domain-containing protein [uncultured Blautia sp.]
MDKNVLIHIRGLQMMDPADEQEPIELVVPGQYYFKNGSHYLRYEELMDETSTEPTVNYIKISSKAVEVRKKGLVNVHMVFERGKKNMTYYSTPYGTVEMGIAATGVMIEESENGIDMKVDYALEMNEEYVADCYLTVSAQSKASGEFRI